MRVPFCTFTRLQQNEFSWVQELHKDMYYSSKQSAITFRKLRSICQSVTMSFVVCLCLALTFLRSRRLPSTSSYHRVNRTRNVQILIVFPLPKTRRGKPRPPLLLLPLRLETKSLVSRGRPVIAMIIIMNIIVNIIVIISTWRVSISSHPHQRPFR